MLNKTFLLFAAAFLTILSCTSMTAETFQEKGQETKEEARLLKTDGEFAAASEAKSAAEAFAIYLADDAIQLADGSNPIVGKKAIVEALGSGYILRWQPKKAEVAQSGDLGWTWGTWELETKVAGESVIRYGKYVNVWRKQRDGNWRVIVDMGNSSPTPQ